MGTNREFSEPPRRVQRDDRAATGGPLSDSVGSRVIDWWPVHLFVAPLLEEAATWPLAGSVAWQDLASDHPAKLAAVLDGGRRDALRNDTTNASLAEASHDISGAANWGDVAAAIRRRSGVYIPRYPREAA